MRKIIGLILFACCPVLHAGTVYQWIDKDGSVVYSDEPPPDIEAVEITIPDSQGAVSASKSGSSDSQRREKLLDSSREVSRQTESRIEQREQLRQQLRTAEAALEAAEQALLEGEVPKAGERIAKVGGGTRLAPAYFQRLDALRESVKRAEEKVAVLKKRLRSLGR